MTLSEIHDELNALKLDLIDLGSDYMFSMYDSIVAEIAYLESEIKLQTVTQTLQR